jgi:arylsulfatase A-like enzyme
MLMGTPPLRFLGLLTGICVLLVWLPGCKGDETGTTPSRAQPNVLLVVIDTLRADAVYGYGAPESQTPALAALAREGTSFTQARSTSAWTVPTHASMFTGLYPSRHNAHNEGRALPPAAITLAELLSPTHETAAFCENPHITRGKHFDQGFEVFRNTWPKRGPEGWRRKITDRLVFEWLESRNPDRPFFLFINYMDPHLPYHPPHRFEKRFLDEDGGSELAARMRTFDDHAARSVIAGRRHLDAAELATLRRLYAAEVAFADSRLGTVLAALRSQALLDETLVIVVGDHGENLGEHGLMEHQLCLYETLLHVPMILRLPGRIPAGTRRDDAVQLVDLFPTVLDLAGVPEDQWPAHEGRNLLREPLEGERLIVAEYMLPLDQQRIFASELPDFDFDPFMRRLKSAQRGTRKLILARGEPTELYDLGDDPGELDNRIDSDPETVRSLLADLSRWQTTRPKPLEIAVGSLDEDSLESLRRLGYID